MKKMNNNVRSPKNKKKSCLRCEQDPEVVETIVTRNKKIEKTVRMTMETFESKNIIYSNGFKQAALRLSEIVKNIYI